MWKAIGAFVVVLLLGAGLWALHEQHSIPPTVIGLLLFGLGGVAGLRAGSDSGTRLMSDMLRLNKILAEENSALVEQNQMLLKLFKSEPDSGL
jgi:hypothetical protein